MLSTFALLAVPFLAVSAQTGIVAGKVTDRASQRPLEDARVVVPGTTFEARTNDLGEYRIANVRAGRMLVGVYKLGFKAMSDTITVVAGRPTTHNFEMTASLVTLSELVITGTAGNLERKAQAALVSSITASNITQSAPIRSVGDLLQSRVPGVALTSHSGSAGAGTTIRIRGASSINLSNQPLLFIDGIRIIEGQLLPPGNATGGQGYDRLNDLNPDEIESIEVVKGPAAATLYGADASAGVIQIITKKGRAGSGNAGFQQSVRMELGTATVTWTPPDNYGLCTAALVASTSTNPLCRGKEVGALVHDNPLMRIGAFRTGTDRIISWNGRGGGQSYGYNLSYGEDHTLGTVSNNNYTRYSVRTNFNYVPTDKLTIDAGLGLTQSLTQLPNNDNNVYGWLGGSMLGSPLTRNDAAAPSNDGWYGFNRHFNAINSIRNTLRTHRVTTNLTTTYLPMPWFNNRVTLGMDFVGDEQLTYFPLNDSSWYQGAANTGSSNQTYRYTERYTFDYLGNVKREFGAQWETNLSFGLQVISTRNSFTNATGQGFVTNANNSIGSAATTTGGSGFTEQRQYGYLGQLQIGHANRRFLQLGVRIDKNSSFGTTADAFVLPKIGGSWAISEEPFFDSYTRWVNTLRFRAAYGTTGRSPLPGAALTTLVAAPYNITGTTGAGAVLGNPGNADLKPERGEELEVGFDAGFFDNRLSAELTYFRKTTKDLIIARPISPSLGFNANPLANIGSVLNSGLELSLNLDALRLRDVEWSVRAGVNTLHNELTSLGTGANEVLPFVLGQAGRTIVGEQLGVFVSKKIQSIDVANSKVIVSDTLTPMGNLWPTLEWNLTNTVTLFKNFRFSAMFDAKRDFLVQNYTAFFRETQLVRSNLRLDTLALSKYERLRHYGDLTPGKPAFVTDKGNSATVSDVLDAYLEKGDFVRLRELSATYTVPSAWLTSLRAVSGASITFAMQNVKLWTDYTGSDPEINAQPTGVNGGFSRQDFLTMPNPRKSIVRVNFNF
ncbi:MAG: SusC/RagA family TonB-linked outer membrane protein [Gemmatimonadaceae bacterium]|nr:SusC/RagA family TonB-linked outer membrane protein [Gemmatimonadaceae bacterium]